MGMRVLLLVLVVFAVCVPCVGQIRTGWNWTPPCKVVKDGIADLVKINFLDNCDMVSDLWLERDCPPPFVHRSPRPVARSTHCQSVYPHDLHGKRAGTHPSLWSV